MVSQEDIMFIVSIGRESSQGVVAHKIGLPGCDVERVQPCSIDKAFVIKGTRSVIKISSHNVNGYPYVLYGCVYLGPRSKEVGSSDRDIVVRKYVRGGKEALSNLDGQYAFAICDEAGRVVGSTDVIGSMPFFFRRMDGDVLLFSSSKIDLSMAGGVALDNVTPFVSKFVDFGSRFEAPDFFQQYGVRKLRGGHTYEWTAESCSISRYWYPDVSDIDDVLTPDVVGAFRDVMRQAVTSRCSSVGKDGILLSGGLDSSAVAAFMFEGVSLGHCREISAFSSTFSNYENARGGVIDEQAFQKCLVDRMNLKYYPVDSSEVDIIDAVENVVSVVEEPVTIPNIYNTWALFAQAGRVGVQTLFDGAEGDIVVSHGTEYLEVLLEYRRWDGFFDGIHAAYTKESGELIAQGIYYWANRAITSLLTSGPRRDILKVLYRFAGLVDVSAFRLARDLGLHSKITALCRGEEKENLLDSFITMSHDVNRNSESAQEIDEVFSPVLWKEGRVRNLLSGRLSRALEHKFLFGKRYEIVPNHPFYDRAVMELCLRIPFSGTLHHGLGRYVMREAVKDLLPRIIARRPGKASLAQPFIDKMKSAEVEDYLREEGGTHLDSLNYEALLRAYVLLRDDKHQASHIHIARTLLRLLACVAWSKKCLSLSSEVTGV